MDPIRPVQTIDAALSDSSFLVDVVSYRDDRASARALQKRRRNVRGKNRGWQCWQCSYCRAPRMFCVRGKPDPHRGDGRYAPRIDKSRGRLDAFVRQQQRSLYGPVNFRPRHSRHATSAAISSAPDAFPMSERLETDRWMERLQFVNTTGRRNAKRPQAQSVRDAWDLGNPFFAKEPSRFEGSDCPLQFSGKRCDILCQGDPAVDRVSQYYDLYADLFGESYYDYDDYDDYDSDGDYSGDFDGYANGGGAGYGADPEYCTQGYYSNGGCWVDNVAEDFSPIEHVAWEESTGQVVLPIHAPSYQPDDWTWVDNDDHSEVGSEWDMI